ncbi:hypothetical protein QTP88_002869 [Uroleucon formosanum]
MLGECTTVTLKHNCMAIDDQSVLNEDILSSPTSFGVLDVSDDILQDCSTVSQNNELPILASNSSNYKFPNDPAIIMETNISSNLLQYFFELGPYQPGVLDMPANKFPITNGRSFREEYYYKKLPDGKNIKRQWLAYSPSKDKIYCFSCMLFGLVKTKKNKLVSTGTQDWKHITLRMLNHEMAKEHLESEISRGQYSTNNRLDVRFRLTTNNQIAENKKIVRVIFEILLYLEGRQNIAFRGHDESLTSKNRGNFLSLIKVLSKYHAPLAIHLNKIENSSKQNRITFLSGQTQNVMLQIMSDSIRSFILKKIKDSRMFAVIIDTTTDISKLEQFTFVVRFVNDEGIVEERLIALEIATDATVHGMFQLFSTICEKHGLDWKNNLYAQAYDGAASMQGPYSGLRTLILQQCPRAKYIWCCAHIINLVIVDMCDSCLDTRNFFGEIQALVEYFGARKRTACFINHQKLLYPGQVCRRLKYLSSTRWTSHDRAIDVIYEKYTAIVESLEELTLSNYRTISSQAISQLKNVTSYKFILMIIFMKKIFKITTPVSVYMQYPKLDFIEAMNLVDSAKKRLEELRNDHKYNKLTDEVKQFVIHEKLEEQDCQVVRIRRKKRMDGENLHNEIIEVANTPSLLFKFQVYSFVLDTVSTVLNSRYSQAREVLKDLKLNIESLRTEYSAFCNAYSSLTAGLNLGDTLHAQESDHDWFTNENYDEEEHTTCIDRYLQEDDDNSVVVNYEGRLNNLNWCSCGYCKGMLSDIECLCCNELPNLEKIRNQERKCITLHQSFSKLILDKEILNITRHNLILKTKNRINKKKLGQHHPENKTWRFICYKQYMSWVNSWIAMGRGYRVVLPACVVQKIREEYPEPNGIYVGFKNSKKLPA